MHQKILILDFGSQVTQLIARRVREAHVYCEVHPCDVTDDWVRQYAADGALKGIILDADGSVLYDLFAEFKITQESLDLTRVELDLRARSLCDREDLTTFSPEGERPFAFLRHRDRPLGDFADLDPVRTGLPVAHGHRLPGSAAGEHDAGERGARAASVTPPACVGRLHLVRQRRRYTGRLASQSGYHCQQFVRK